MNSGKVNILVYQAPGACPPPSTGAGPCVAPPPPVGHPTKDGAAHGYAYSQNSAAPVQTKSGGESVCFWKACASVLCCCCAVEGWFHT